MPSANKLAIFIGGRFIVATPVGRHLLALAKSGGVKILFSRPNVTSVAVAPRLAAVAISPMSLTFGLVLK